MKEQGLIVLTQTYFSYHFSQDKPE